MRAAALVIMQLALFADEEAHSGLRGLLTNLAGLIAPAEGG
ncbi:hypothetical protein [Muricoccus nepalensis]|nr:hypothetical protein [Roseomonas nepalensis]